MKPLTGIAAVSLLLACAVSAMGAGVNAYDQTVLVANDPIYNPLLVDTYMNNAWGIALRPPGAGGHIWVNGGRSGTSLEYIGDVNGIPLHQDGLQVVPLDTAGFADKGYASVTGLAYNAASDLAGQVIEFSVAGPANDNSTNPPTAIPGGTSGAAKFIFVTKDGTINAWRSNTTTAMASAPVVIDYSKTSTFPYQTNPVYTGVAMSVNPVISPDATMGNHLFATDFRNNVIEVFDNQWKDVTASFHFATPDSVGILHPYNVVDLAGHLYVTYAEWDPASDEGFEDIPGSGHLVEYNEDGSLVKDFSGGDLNSPWGVALAPAPFGAVGGDVLVANFAEGTISAFDPASGAFIDTLRDSQGNPISIDGVWGLTFGNGVSLGDANSLYFTAGPNSEQDGMLGKLTVAPEPGTLALLVTGAAVFLKRRLRRNFRK